MKLSTECLRYLFVFFNDTATTEIYTLSLHDALPIWLNDDADWAGALNAAVTLPADQPFRLRIEVEERSGDASAERLDRKSTRLNSQSRQYLVCRLLLEKKNNH